VEREDTAKRRILSACQEHIRMGVEVARRVPRVVDCLVREDKEGAQQLYLEIRKLEEEADEARMLVVKELTDVGAILTCREDFLRFIDQVHEILDFCEGAAFRITEILERTWKIPDDSKAKVVKMADAMLDTVMKLRDVATTLGYNATTTTEKALDVEAAEKAADTCYRDAEMNIISSKIDVPTLLLLREVVQFMEDAADKAEDAAKAARILAFSL